MPQAGTARASLRLALVRDPKHDLALLSNLANSGGFRLTAVLNAAEGDAASDNSEPEADCVLLDTTSVGWSAIPKWNERLSPRRIALVAVGDRDEPAASNEALRLGAQAYLCSSQVDEERLRAAVNRAIQQVEQSGDKLPLFYMGADPAESAATIHALFEHASQGILMTDAEGRIVQANKMVEELFGYTRPELLGQSVERLLPKSLRAAHARHRAGYHASPRPRKMGLSRDLVALRKDGSEFPVEISLSHIPTRDGALSVAFISDITIRARAEADLRRSEARFQAFMENSPALALIKDELGRIIWTNHSYQELFNFRPEFHGKTVFDLWPEAFALRLHNHDAQVFASKTPHEFLEILPTPIGDRHFLSIKFPFVGDQSQTMLGAVIIDVTDHNQQQEQIRHALEEKTTLLKEVHHRVKNNLAVVSSLLSIQAGSSEGPSADALADSQLRVQAMAMVHEHLYGSDSFDRVDFREYTNRMAREIAIAFNLGGGNISLVVETEPLELGLDAAVPAALILNELITNAAKYAFPGGRQGVIKVEMRTTPDQKILLAVGDNGIGLPPGLRWREANSLGLKIVQLLTKQLSATIDLAPGPGTRFEILLPQGVVAQ